MNITHCCVFLYIQTISQTACHVGRVRYEPNENASGNEIREYIEKHLSRTNNPEDLSKRGTRRTTYEVVESKVKYVPKPDRMRELAKNLWKMKTMLYCIKEKTIYHLINTFPELNDLIKENETYKTNVYQKPVQQNNKRGANKVFGAKYGRNIAHKNPETATGGKEKDLRLGMLGIPINKQNESTLTSKARSSRTPSLQSEPQQADGEEKEYDYVNQIEAYDLTYEDDQESIDKLEATLMDESIIELTNTFR